MDPRKLLEKSISKIDIIVDIVCKKRNITGDLIGDFKSYVYEKLLENDGRRLTEYQGNHKASWNTYLSVVITRLAIDYMKKTWGRWENSTSARQLGIAAMNLETMIYRDKIAFSEAVERILENPEFTVMYRYSQIEADQLKSRIPEGPQKSLEFIKKETFFPKKEFEANLDEIPDKNISRFKQDILQTCGISLNCDMLSEWDLSFQHRAFSSHSGLSSAENRQTLDFSNPAMIEQIRDNSKQSPLENLISSELELMLEEKVTLLLSQLNSRDWMILSLYLVDNMRVSEIARVMDGGRTPASNLKKSKKTVSSRSWKEVNKRIVNFMDQLRKWIEKLEVEKEEQEMVSRFCLSLITKKIQKNE